LADAGERRLRSGPLVHHSRVHLETVSAALAAALALPDHAWYATEADKVERFRQLDVQHRDGVKQAEDDEAAGPGHRRQRTIVASAPASLDTVLRQFMDVMGTGASAV
jgi:hypothetical protein